ncbi:MAG: hypothetical protein GXY74_03695 [Phycisphaerae bacterium]|nr:hypothetical protein [Phycisphaerae bacterium]
MWQNWKQDEYGIPGDIPQTRRTLLQVATTFNIYVILVVALAGAVVFIGGVVMAQSEEVGAQLDSIPEPIMLMAVGMMCFSLCCPFFMALYFGRHFLRSVMHLEAEIARLKAQVNAGQDGSTNDEEA